MRVVYCDACRGILQDKGSTADHTVQLDNTNAQDLCAKCYNKLREILGYQQWRTPEAG